MSHGKVGRVRSFNRLVTQRIGALQDSYLSRGRPLGQARLIFEIGPDGTDLRDLRTRLALDSGYLSRLLRELERQGLVSVGKAEGDARLRRVQLTPAGHDEWQAYDSASDGLAHSILEPLTENERERLVAAMQQVERLLRTSALSISVEPPGRQDARRCLAEYMKELAERFEDGFDPAKGNSVSEEDMTPPSGYFLLARLDGVAVGCGALLRVSDDTAEIKRMWTAREARGQGVASRLLQQLEELAAKQGFRRVVLDTNRALAEAQALYRRLGYAEIPRYNDNPYAHHWFAKDLGQPGS